MQMKTIARPLMGGLMGLMMLRVAHGVMTQESDLAGSMLFIFVIGHFVAIGVFVALVIWSARYAPALRARLDRLHLPSLRHVVLMMGSAIGAAFVAHLFIHGGL